MQLLYSGWTALVSWMFWQTQIAAAQNAISNRIKQDCEEKALIAHDVTFAPQVGPSGQILASESEQLSAPERFCTRKKKKKNHWQTYLNALGIRHFSPEEHATGRVLNSHKKISIFTLSGRLGNLSLNTRHFHSEMQCSLDMWLNCKKLQERPKASNVSLPRSRANSMAQKFAIHRCSLSRRNELRWKYVKRYSVPGWASAQKTCRRHEKQQQHLAANANPLWLIPLPQRCF